MNFDVRYSLETDSSYLAIISIQKRGFKTLLAYLGPGFLVAIAYIDPGNCKLIAANKIIHHVILT
jgi:hypothetical protein